MQCLLSLMRWVAHGALQEELLQQGPEMWDPEYQARENAYIDGRAGNVGRFKPGVQDQLLVFSDQDGASAVQLPWMEHYKPWLEPLLDEVHYFPLVAACTSK